MQCAVRNVDYSCLKATVTNRRGEEIHPRGIRTNRAPDKERVVEEQHVTPIQFGTPGHSQHLQVTIQSLTHRFHLPRSLPIRNEALRLPLLGDFYASPQQVYGRPDWDFVLKGFIDAGRTIRNAPRNGLPRPLGETNDFLLGVGAGAELRFRQNLTVRVDWGQALRSTPDVKRGSSEVNLLFSVVY